MHIYDIYTITKHFATLNVLYIYIYIYAYMEKRECRQQCLQGIVTVSSMDERMNEQMHNLGCT